MPRKPTAPKPKATARGKKRLPVATVFEARATWADEDDDFWNGGISGAVLDNGTLKFDWLDGDDETVEITKLHTNDGMHFKGNTEKKADRGDDTAVAEGTLYSNSQGHLLVGKQTWRSDQRIEWFIVQLSSAKQIKK